MIRRPAGLAMIDRGIVRQLGQIAQAALALVPSTDRNPNAPAALRTLKEMVANWHGPGTIVPSQAEAPN